MERTQGLLAGLLGALKSGLAPSPRRAPEEGGGSSRTRILLIGLFGAVAVIGVLVGLVGWQMGWIKPEARPGQHRDRRPEQPASAMPAPSSSIAGPSAAAPGITAPAPAETPVAAPQAPAKSEGQATVAAPAERRPPGPGVGAVR